MRGLYHSRDRKMMLLIPSINILMNSPSQSLKLKRAVPTGYIRITNKKSTHYNRYKSTDQLIFILFHYIYIFVLCIYNIDTHTISCSF